MYTCMCDWVTLLYSRKLAEHCKPAIMEKNKNHLKIFYEYGSYVDSYFKNVYVEGRQRKTGIFPLPETTTTDPLMYFLLASSMLLKSYLIPIGFCCTHSMKKVLGQRLSPSHSHHYA